MKINAFIKMFDRELIEILILNSTGIAFLMIHFYSYSIGSAFLIAPVVSVSAFLGIIALAHLFSLTMDMFDKGFSTFR